MKVNGKKIKEMEKENKNIKMVIYMKVNLKIMKKMEKVYINMKMVI